jgi:tetratricopeptide (TPR) repeat protein/serine/threonine protein kinase
MSPNEESVFADALAIQDPGERAAFLDRACADNPGLRQDVESLLSAYDAGAFLESPAPAPGVTAAWPAVGEGPGGAVGSYKLLEQIGEGGFGVVFLAEQQHPVRRKVALKVVKPGMDSRQVIARFEAERQALALMDHPNIAHVLDAGATASGRPYFVMELVRGVAITDYCDQNQLPPRERLGLFALVCQAVQHAHQKGIIHRDLKPSNVLVTLHDGTPVVKVIDFGIAKALGRQLTDKTLFTGIAQMIGTPLYMSPEQAEMSGLDVDTRSDVYSLGVLLYELLTGTTPFDPERLRQAGHDEMRRILREEEPPRPSTRLSTLGPAAATVSARRQSDPRRLCQAFRGELDWIVMKALEKDRNRRYETASAFAADVQRYLKDEPVQACPPSAAYRFGKFARRHRTGLAAAGLVLFCLVLLGGGVGWVLRDRGARRAETEREVTVALAEAEALDAQGWKQIDDPDRWQATVGLARSAVQRAEGLLATGVATGELADRVRATRGTVEEAARASSLRAELDRIRLEQASAVKESHKESHFDQEATAPLYAAALRDYGIDPASPEEAAARVRSSPLREALLAALQDWARVSPQQAERQRLKEVLRLAEPEPDAFGAQWRAAWARRDGPALAQLARQPRVERLPAQVLSHLASDLRAVGELAAAAQLLRAGQERYPDDFWLNHQLGTVLGELKPAQTEEAVRFLTVALALRPRSPGAYVNLGVALHDKGDEERSIRCYRAAVEISPRYAWAHYNLGNALKAKGDVDGAIRSYRSALDSNPQFAAAHYYLGSSLYLKGDMDGATRCFRAALAINPDYPEIHYNLGNALKAMGDVDGAIRSYRNALDIKPKLIEAHKNLGNALKAKGDVDGAIRSYRNALDIKPKLIEAHKNLGHALYTKRDLDGAIRCYRAALDLKPQDAGAHCDLGIALEAKGDVDGAIRSYRTALDLNPKLAEAHCNLGDALEAKGDVDGAIRCFRAALAINPDYAEAHCNLGLALKRQGHFADALAALQRGHALGSRKPHWPNPSAQWVRDTQALAGLDAKLPKILQGEVEPADAAERLAFARLCQLFKKRPVAAVRFYAGAFAAEPKRAADLTTADRYDAACAAVLAAAGQGEDAGALDDRERARLRQQALDWLRADLTAWQQRLEKEPGKARPLAQAAMRRWQQAAGVAGEHATDEPERHVLTGGAPVRAGLAGVRGAEALARLPEAERPAWRQLWDEVEALARRTEEPKR